MGYDAKKREANNGKEGHENEVIDSYSLIPKVNTATFFLLMLLLFVLSGFFYNLLVIVEYKTSPPVADIFTYFLVLLQAFLWGIVFLGWVKYIGLKKRVHAFIGLLCIVLVALKSLGFLLILREAGFIAKSVPAFLSLLLKASFLYIVILIFWRGLKDKLPSKALIRDKRYFCVLILLSLFYGMYLLTGPGHIVSSPKFAINAAQQYLDGLEKASNYRGRSFRKDIDFYQQLYSLGRPKAAIYLGIFNEVEGDLRAAENWYFKAASLDHKKIEKSKNKIADSPDGRSTALQIYRSEALADNASATFLYATLIDMQNNPKGEDIIFWYERAAELGRKEAVEILADYYWAGKHIQKDSKKACLWGRRISQDSMRRWRYKFLCSFFK